MVQAMWNHGPVMQEQIKKGKMKYPILTGQDVVDIASYLRQASTTDVEVRLSVGNPKNGRILFEEKRCADCHVGEGKRKRIEVGLIKIDLKKGVTEVASAMWNHGQAMLEFMQRESIDWPRFAKNEMADIIAYIYFLGFEDQPGDPAKGQRVFQDKGCNGCHAKGGQGKGPDLGSIRKISTPVRMIQLMWNHAGEMEDLLITKNKRWPELTTNEMRDLYGYLRKKD
jgi:cytochrome c